MSVNGGGGGGLVPVVQNFATRCPTDLVGGYLPIPNPVSVPVPLLVGGLVGGGGVPTSSKSGVSSSATSGGRGGGYLPVPNLVSVLVPLPAGGPGEKKNS